MATTQLNTQQYKDSSVTAAKVGSDVITAAGTNAYTGPQSMGGYKLTNLAAGTNPGDAVTLSQLTSAVTGMLLYKGSIDCSANPNYPAGTLGDSYIVSVAGKIGGASGTSVDVGDWIVCDATNAGGTEAAVGSSWGHMEHNLVGALLASNNLSDVGNPSTARSNLGATTPGSNLFTLPNPGAVTFLQVNADGSVSALSASAFRTAIGAGAGAPGTLVVRETPSGTVNGSNVTFTLANTPVSGTEQVYVNGEQQDAGAGNDYTISTNTITFLTGAIPQSSDKIRVTYWH